jgi:hypothetical protein
MLAGHAAEGRAQAEAGGGRSTLSGVFNAGQASEGAEVYAARCRACHTQAAHVTTFKQAWSGRPLAEPFGYLLESMPKDSPGTLSAGETAVLLAYFLQMIGMPAGNDTLPADAAALNAIQIDTLAGKPRHAAEEKRP